MESSMSTDPFLIAAFATTGLAVLLLLWFLLRRPRIDRVVKIVLLFGIGILPLMTAANGSVAGYNATKQRSFCGSCHVMTPYSADSDDPRSTTLAARHARNELFGAENCYTCHEDYGMFGTVLTKLGGLRHVYEYVFHYRNMPTGQFLREIEIRKPFPNGNCIHCHSTENPLWNAIGDHTSTRERLRAGTLSCASEGCAPVQQGGEAAMKLKLPTSSTLLRISAVLTLLALGLMVWSMMAPTPLPVMLAMTVGQGLGTLAFAMYILVVIRDLRRKEPPP
jgi:cytochrome c-type protein NapC